MEECYDDIGSLVKDLASLLGLKSCLHPSEYDRAQTLLICRSVEALENDIIGTDRSEFEQKFFIPRSSLSRLENYKVMKGRFTKLWKAQWRKSGSKDKMEDVAVKELCYDHHLQPFMHMCHNTMLWNDSTLIKIHGAVLATPGNPMALVMENMPRGKIDAYFSDYRINSDSNHDF